MAENRILNSVLFRIDEEWKKRMDVEDKCSINNHQSFKTSMYKVDLDMMTLKERKRGSAAIATAPSSGCGSIGGDHRFVFFQD